MQRRTFLKGLAALPALGALSGRLFAAPAGSPYFLLVFLRGGFDCNHLLAPWASDFYYEARPHLALPRPDGSAERQPAAGRPVGARPLVARGL